MYDYILVYYMLTAMTAAPVTGQPLRNLPRPDAWSRVAAVSVNERFGSLDSCRQRIESIRYRVAQTNVPSERFELDCHPVPRSGGQTTPAG